MFFNFFKSKKKRFVQVKKDRATSCILSEEDYIAQSIERQRMKLGDLRHGSSSREIGAPESHIVTGRWFI
jgi:hypothetical protein